MKINMTSIFKPIITKIIDNMPSVKLERKIDNFKAIVDRNKLIAPAIIQLMM